MTTRGMMMTAVHAGARGLYFSVPRHMQPLTVFHGMWERRRVLQHPQDREAPAPHGLGSAPAVSGQNSGSGHTGAGGKVTGSGGTLPWLS